MRKLTTAVVGTVAAALALTGCGGGSDASGGGGGDKLSLVGFSILEQANKPVIADWKKTADGKGVTFETSYGASGDQSRAVEGGLSGRHRALLAGARRAASGRQRPGRRGLERPRPTKGILTQSVVVIVVRKGNPKNIQGWDDLVKPGVKIITPNPASSGSAKWNILAAYGHVLANGGNEADAKAYLTKFFDNVAALPGQRS